MSDRQPRYVVWDPETGIPAALSTSSDLVRWAQSRHLTSLEAWVVLTPARQIVRASMSREGTRWAMKFEDETVYLPADASDDTRTLNVVSLLAEAENESLRLVRHSLADWPPPGSRVGARVGSMPPVVVDDHWEWHYCPELIADLTRSLDDRDFWLYLQSVDMRASLAVVHRHLSGPDLEQLLDELLHEKLGRGHMNMLMRIRMLALDRPAPWENTE